MDAAPTIPYIHQSMDNDDVSQKSEEYKAKMLTRRSIRTFSDKPVPKSVIENILSVANSAPSGANKQPWSFCVISNPALKKEIREKAEAEEFVSYNGRMSHEWLNAIKPLNTNHVKEFITTAPYIIVVFKCIYEIVGSNKVKYNNYYVSESVGIATGFLISAIHNAGLVTLTHTPSPMDFLHKVLNRPSNERAYMLLPVGYPAEGVEVPDIDKKGLNDVAFFYE